MSFNFPGLKEAWANITPFVSLDCYLRENIPFWVLGKCMDTYFVSPWGKGGKDMQVIGSSGLPEIRIDPWGLFTY